MREVVQFVVKVAGRCNIACTYCYMYELGDSSALDGPKAMSQATLEQCADRIIQHVADSDIDVIVSVHGGEPLMIKVLLFKKFSTRLRTALDKRLTLCVQTNGILIDNEWIQAFVDTGAIVGISLDGPERVNDVHRVDHRGNGTYARTLEGYELVRKASDCGLQFGGLISVINPRQSPRLYYEWLKDLNTPCAGILFPDANHDNYSVYYDYSSAEFSDYLLELFDCWWNDPDPVVPDIRLFKNIVSKICGGHSDSESIGTGNSPAIIIETDGSIEAHDVSRMNHGRSHQKPNILRNAISEVHADPVYQRLNPPDSKLCGRCTSCPVSDICGGGMILHRYSQKHGYDGPSVYCQPLFDICTHAYLAVSARINSDTSHPIAA